MSDLDSLLAGVDRLPNLPDLAGLKEAAFIRRDHFVAIRDEAQREVDNAEAIISALGGKNGNSTGEKIRNASPETYRNVLSSLAERDYAGIHTLAADSRVSRGHVGIVMKMAEERDHAERTNPHQQRRFRWRLTAAGMEFLTRPALPVNGSRNGVGAH